MEKYFKTVPVYFLLFYAMMCYGCYGVHVLYRMFWYTTERMVGHGIATSLVFGFSAAFLGRYPRHFSIYSNYSILFITAVSLLALHFVVKLIRR